MRLSMAMLLSLLFALPTLAADTPKNLVKAELLIDASTVKPGDTFTAGVLLRITPDWHIYWTNPGESGAATEVKFKVEGAKVGAAQFPIPITFKMPGDIIGYGYTDEVMILATVEVPDDAKVGTELKISADASWLCCHDICVMGNAKLDKTVQVAAATARQNEETFPKWRDALPKVSTQATDVQNILQTIDQSTAPTKATGKLHIDVAWEKAPSEIEFYPPAGPSASFTLVSIKTVGNRSALNVSFEAKFADKSEKASPQAILAYKSGSKRYGVVIPLEIDRPVLPESATRPTADAAGK